MVCQPILSAADLAGPATEADAVVEGTSPDKSSTFEDSDVSEFDVTETLKALPGVDPEGAIQIVFGPPNSGDFLPAGKYLLFLLYNPIAKVYEITSSSQGDDVTEGKFLIDGDTATEKSCASRSDAGDAPSAVASWFAMASAPPLSTSELEAWVRQLTLGRTLLVRLSYFSSHIRPRLRRSEAGTASSESRHRSRPTGRESRKLDAQIQLENATVFGEEPLTTVPHLELARVTVAQGSVLPRGVERQARVGRHASNAGRRCRASAP